MTETIYLILGTSCMVIMMMTIIVFVLRFQKKLADRNKAYHAIEKMMNKQELQSAYAILEGQEAERKRIASELHDNIGGLIATLKIYSDLTVTKEDPMEIARLNEKINGLTENLGQEVRKLSHDLDLRTLSGFGFKVAVQQLAEAITSSGKLMVASVFELSNTMEDDVALNLYRIIQELLTNTLKHAQATQARIEIVVVGSEITLIYDDDGKGFDSRSNSNQGMGLNNIRARAEIIDAKLTIDSSPRGSTFIIESEPNDRH